MVKIEPTGYRFVKQPVKMLAIYEMQPKELRRSSEGWFLDMGQEITGVLEMEAESSGDGACVVVRCGEELTEEGNVRYDMRCGCTYEETWTLRKGTNRLEPYDYKGFRYGQILCGPETKIRRIRAVVRHYPMDETLCTFRSDRKTVNQIFEPLQKRSEIRNAGRISGLPYKGKGTVSGRCGRNFPGSGLADWFG